MLPVRNISLLQGFSIIFFLRVTNSQRHVSDGQMITIVLCISMYIGVDKGPNKYGLRAEFDPRAAIWEGLSYLIPMYCSIWEKCINNPKTGQGAVPFNNILHVQIPLTSYVGLPTYSWAPRAFSLKTPNKREYCTTHTCAALNLRDDRHTWTDRNSLTEIGRQWVRNTFGKVLLHILHKKKCI